MKKASVVVNNQTLLISLTFVILVFGCVQVYVFSSSGDSVEDLVAQLTVEEYRLRKSNINMHIELLNHQWNLKKQEAQTQALKQLDLMELAYVDKFIETKTTHTCYQLEDFSEICVYNNLCFNGKHHIFLDPDYKKNPQSLLGHEVGTHIEWVYNEAKPFPPKKSQYAPYGSLWSDTSDGVYPQIVNPKYLTESVKSIEYLSGSIYYGSFLGDNHWHSTIQGMNLWSSQLFNYTLPESAKLPPIDFVYLSRSYLNQEIQHFLYSLMVQEHTKFIVKPWINSNFESVEEAPENFKMEPRTLLDRPLDETNIICSEKAVIYSQKPRVFSGFHDARKFREKLYDVLDFPLSPLGVTSDGEVKYSGNVIIDIRGEGLSRNLVNNQEIASLVEYYGLKAHIVPAYDGFTDVDTMAKQLNSADVLIAVHGGAILNSIFMKPNGAVIEIFPYGIHSPKYKYLVNSLDMHYIEVMSWLKGDKDGCAKDLYTSDFLSKCQFKSNIVNALDGYCLMWSKNACVVGPLYEVELALISAYRELGVNLRSRASGLFSMLPNTNLILNDFHAQFSS